MSGDNASCGVIFDRYREFSSIGKRLDQIEAEYGAAERGRRVGDVMAAAVGSGAGHCRCAGDQDRDVVFKMRLLTSFLAEGELRLALTSQCVEECERVLVVEGETDRGFMALEPGCGTPVNGFARA